MLRDEVTIEQIRERLDHLNEKMARYSLSWESMQILRDIYELMIMDPLKRE